MKSDSRLLIVALVLGVVLAVIIAVTTAASPAPDLSTRGDNREGAMALRLWLRRSGYDTQEIYDFSDLYRVNVLFILQPLWFYYDETDGETLRQWVERGGTLVIAGAPERVNPLLTAFDVELDYLTAGDAELASAAHTLRLPPAAPFTADAFAAVTTGRQLYTPHLFSGDSPVLVSFHAGAGTVWVAGFVRPFTNQGLHDEGAAQLIRNLLPADSMTALIGFDEGAHGFTDPSQSSLIGWLLRTAPGWGVVTALVITLIFLASRGKRFGRPQPLPDERLRRDSVEYIQAIGGLFRRSGERAEILKHYNGQLRRRLSERYGVDPALPPTDLVKAVVYHDSSVDETTLRPLLQGLAANQVSEHDLISLATDVDTFLRSMT